MMQCNNFAIRSGSRQVTWSLIEPADDEQATDPAIVIVFAGTRSGVAAAESGHDPAGAFVRAGHRVISMDIPSHGERVITGQPQGLHGLCAALEAGQDPFEPFVTDVVAVIDACVDRGIARAGRIFAAGRSRLGYAALRLAAADRRIGGVAAYAPVVDWRILSEFARVKDAPIAASVALAGFVDQLAARPILVIIGEHDERVGTACVEAFATSLGAVPWDGSSPSGNLPLLAIDATVEGHTVSDRWVRAGAGYLLALADARPERRIG